MNLSLFITKSFTLGTWLRVLLKGFAYNVLIPLIPEKHLHTTEAISSQTKHLRIRLFFNRWVFQSDVFFSVLCVPSAAFRTGSVVNCSHG